MRITPIGAMPQTRFQLRRDVPSFDSLLALSMKKALVKKAFS